MACSLFGTEPLPELMLTYCQLGPYEQTLGKFESRERIFFHKNALENVDCEMAALLSKGRWINIRNVCVTV